MTGIKKCQTSNGSLSLMLSAKKIHIGQYHNESVTLETLFFHNLGHLIICNCSHRYELTSG